jgi:uncharacterized membrane protein YesL
LKGAAFVLSNFFNKMYYGKAGKGDYRPEDLPANRWQLFFEMLRIRWSGLVRANLFYVLFWLPAILWTALNAGALYNVLVASLEEEGLLAADAMTTLIYQYLIGMIPCIAITGPFTAGITMILRNWARDQHSFFMSDFWETVKTNWKQALAVSAVTSVMPFILWMCWTFYSSLAAQNFLFVIPQMLTMVAGGVWALSLTIMYPLMITYDLKLGALIRNAVILSVGRLPQALGIRLVTLIIPFIAAALILFTSIAGYTLLVIILFYIVLGFALNRFIYVSFANMLCDRYINPRIEGAAVNMGLRQYTDEDYETDPTLPQPKRDD